MHVDNWIGDQKHAMHGDVGLPQAIKPAEGTD